MGYLPPYWFSLWYPTSPHASVSQILPVLANCADGPNLHSTIFRIGTNTECKLNLDDGERVGSLALGTDKTLASLAFSDVRIYWERGEHRFSAGKRNKFKTRCLRVQVICWPGAHRRGSRNKETKNIEVRGDWQLSLSKTRSIILSPDPPTSH